MGMVFVAMHSSGRVKISSLFKQQQQQDINVLLDGCIAEILRAGKPMLTKQAGIPAMGEKQSTKLDAASSFQGGTLTSLSGIASISLV